MPKTLNPTPNRSRISTELIDEYRRQSVLASSIDHSDIDSMDFLDQALLDVE
jgi:hypothetical protein